MSAAAPPDDRGPALGRVCAALDAAGCGPERAGKWRCPAHADRSPSLGVSQGDKGALVRCFAGCSTNDVVAALGMSMADLFDDRQVVGARSSDARPRRVACYEYCDRYGEPLRRKVRLEPGYDGKSKTFLWELPDGAGGWKPVPKDGPEKGTGNPRVPYRLPELVEADVVHVGEGEKAADALAAHGIAATCSPSPGEWSPAYSEALRGKHVVIWEDRDKPGAEFASRVASALDGIAASVRIVRAAVEVPKADAFDHLAAGLSIEQAEEVRIERPLVSAASTREAADREPRANRVLLDRVSFSGSRLLALLDRPSPPPVEAARPVDGHLMLLVAPSMTGKSSLALASAMARAAGSAPWAGAGARPPGRVLFYSLDEAPEQVARRLRGLATFHPAGAIARYADRLVVIGPDRELAPDALEGLRFDERGLAVLTRWLEEAATTGDPFAEVYVDAYADVLPLGESENSNEEATRIGGALERLAVRHGCAICLLHHAGKPKADAAKDELVDVRFIARGASALAAKARVVCALEKVSGMPHLRRVRTATNLGPAPRAALFEVCAENTESEEILYFRPAAEPTARDPREFLAPGEEINSTELARRLAGEDLPEGREPPGELKMMATRMRTVWLETGLVSVKNGPRGAKLITLVNPEERLN